MPDKPDDLGIEGLAAMAARLDELETLFGPDVRPAIARLRAALLCALAARDRGDAPGAIVSLRSGMDELVRLFADVDPNEAAAMRQLVAGLERALLSGEGEAAGRIADDMMRRSGAVERGSRGERDANED